MTDEPEAAPEPVRIDLDAIRAVKAAEEKVGPVVVFHEVEYPLPSRLSISMMSKIGALREQGRFALLREVLDALFDEATVALLWDELDVDTTNEFLDAIALAYGIRLGNS